MRIPIMGKGVTLTELPNEIAVYFEVGNCQQKCKGCHSPHLWTTDLAEWLNIADMRKYIESQKGATAVLFMGGTTNWDIHPKEFLERIVKPLSKDYPIGLYHGDAPFMYDRGNLTWIKTGRYIECQGGLDSPTTNQRMYYKTPLNEWIDITKWFTRKESE